MVRHRKIDMPPFQQACTFTAGGGFRCRETFADASPNPQATAPPVFTNFKVGTINLKRGQMSLMETRAPGPTGDGDTQYRLVVGDGKDHAYLRYLEGEENGKQFIVSSNIRGAMQASELPTAASGMKMSAADWANFYSQRQ
jgi:hypothetical protein